MGINVYARRYCPGGYTWQQHLGDVKDSKRSLFRLLGRGGQKHWDYIVFQVSQQPATICRCCNMLRCTARACSTGSVSAERP